MISSMLYNFANILSLLNEHTNLGVTTSINKSYINKITRFDLETYKVIP